MMYLMADHFRDLQESSTICLVLPCCWLREKTAIYPTMQSIPVDHPFQIIGVDIVELPSTTYGNRSVIAFQDLFTTWLMVYTAEY